jgi:hypothetical protein
MKTLSILLTILFLTGFTVDNNPKFRVDILFNYLPDPTHINYRIDNKTLLVCNSQYDNKKNGLVDFNKSSYNKFDRHGIIKFLQKTDWESIPKKLVTPTIDGYQCIIKLEIENEKYDFTIDNTYHETIDSLFTICNKLIPDKQKQKEYYITYHK